MNVLRYDREATCWHLIQPTDWRVRAEVDAKNLTMETQQVIVKFF